MDKGIQCKHIAETEIIAACRDISARVHRGDYRGPLLDTYFGDRFPEAVVWRKVEKMVDRGILEYGVSWRTAFVCEDVYGHRNPPVKKQKKKSASTPAPASASALPD